MISNIQIKVEPMWLFPSKHFVFNQATEKLDTDRVDVIKNSRIYLVDVGIFFEKIGMSAKDLYPSRINVQVQKSMGKTISWRPNHPITSKLMLGSDNPSDLDWLLF